MSATLNPVHASADPAPHYGVVPWRRARATGLRILLVAEHNHGWSVPARTAAPGGAPFVTAALAAFEEAGIIGDIDTAPLAAPQDAMDGRLVLFAMNVRGTLSHWKGKDARRRGWFSPQEAAARVGDRVLSAFLGSLEARPHLLTASS